MTVAQADSAVLVVPLSMILAPLLFAATERWIILRLGETPTGGGFVVCVLHVASLKMRRTCKETASPMH